MAMDYSAAYDYTIEADKIASISPAIKEAYDRFNAVLTRNNRDLDWFAESHESGDEPEARDVYDEAKDEFAKLKELFDKETGLKIDVAYHNRYTGSRYDEVTGGYFSLCGVEMLTPAGEAWKHIFYKAFFVNHG